MAELETCGVPARVAAAVIPAPPWWITASHEGSSAA